MRSEISRERTHPGAIFVGREREIGELRAGLEEVLGGNGRLFLIAGEPGIGKTRLTEEIAREAARREARALWGRCWEEAGAPAFWPWVQIMRSCLEGSSAESLASLLGTRAPYVARYCCCVFSPGRSPTPAFW